MGAGAGILVLEELERARARGARIYGEIVGYGANCDAYHITAPAAGGAGAAECMRLALEDAGLSGQDAKYVQGFRADLDAKADTISRDGYNALVDAFNTKVLGVFPANFLRHIAFVRGAEAFR